MLRYCLLFIMLCFLFPSWIYGWDDQNTHPTITDEAIKHAKDLESFLTTQLGIEDDTELNNGEHNKNIIEWLQTGSTEEDDPMCRAANHFHNPLKHWKEAMLSDNSQAIDIICKSIPTFSAYSTKYSNLVWATGLVDTDQTRLSPPVNYTSDPDAVGVAPVDPQLGYSSDIIVMEEVLPQKRNWWVARNVFYHSLIEEESDKREKYLAETFRTIGFVSHLLQDTGVPAHTRNDFSKGHVQQPIGCPGESIFCNPLATRGNPFEGYVRDHFKTIKVEISNNAQPLSRTFEGEKTLSNFWDTDTHLPNTTPNNFAGQDLGLAEYSNANFVSFATIFENESNILHYFPYPNRESIVDDEFPEKVSIYLQRDVLAKDWKYENQFFIEKDKHGEVINKFLTPRYIMADDAINLASDTVDIFSPEVRYDLILTHNDDCFLEYATKIIPRTIGYTSGLIDYFFRGKLEITPFQPQDLTIRGNGKGDIFIFGITAGIRNATMDPDEQNNTLYTNEEVGLGTLRAIAKYEIDGQDRGQA